MKRFDPTTLEGNEARLNHGDSERVRLKEEGMTKLFPVQADPRNRKAATIPEPVYMAAYEVYKAVHGSQEALITGDCRGGFSSGELIAFLYARSCPRQEWRKRVDEAFEGMNV